MPVIGYLGIRFGKIRCPRLTGVPRRVERTGYVEGRNLTIEYRWAEANLIDCRPVTELIQMRVAVIVTPGLSDTRGKGCDHHHPNSFWCRR